MSEIYAFVTGIFVFCSILCLLKPLKAAIRKKNNVGAAGLILLQANLLLLFLINIVSF